MPFDGYNYERAPLIGPYYAHSRVQGLGDVFAGNLQQAYFYSRKHANLVGVQSYRNFLKTISTHETYGNVVRATSPIIIADFRRLIPAHATHLIAETIYRVRRVEPIVVNHLIEATDGTSTSTGTTVNDVFEDELDENEAEELLVASVCNVAVQASLLGSSLEIQVKANAEGITSSNAAGYFPISCTCFWHSEQ